MQAKDYRKIESIIVVDGRSVHLVYINMYLVCYDQRAPRGR